MKAEIIMLNSEAYNQLKNELTGLLRYEVKRGVEEVLKSLKVGDDWMTAAEVRSLLGIGRTKYFELKNADAFVFSQFGRKSKISRKSVEAFLKKNTGK